MSCCATRARSASATASRSTTRSCSTRRARRNRGIDIGDGVFLGRGTILSCKDGDIALGEQTNLGFHCEIFSGSSVTVGRHGLFAAQAYLVGGGHQFEDAEQAVIDQPRTSKGITLGDNVWLGTGAKVLDGVRDRQATSSSARTAWSTADLPDGAIAAGVPARVLRRRQPAAGRA